MRVARTPTRRRGPPMFAAVTDDAAARRRARAHRLRGLYAVTPDLADTVDLVARVEAAIAGGATAIQYRNKIADAATRRAQAAALAARSAHGALFVVNDDAALAAAVGADGVHVGEDDGSVDGGAPRARPGRNRRRFVLQRFARAEAAVAAGADYVAFGSFFRRV